MNKRENWKAVIGVIVIMTLLLLSGCRSVRTVEVEKVRTEYKSKTDTLVQKDSVWCHDSIMTYIDGDTKYVDRWHTTYKDRYIYKNLVDTVIKTDSIPTIVEVEKKMNFWEQTKSNFFMPLVGIALILGLIVYTKK